MRKALIGGIFASLLAAVPAHAIVVDGSRAGEAYDRVATQTVETGFGDNESEWNAAYADVWNGTLNLMFAGNLQSNFNKLEIFIDSTDAVTTNVLTTAGNDGSAAMDGMTFDAGFAPDYHLIVRRGTDGDPKFDVDFSNLATGQFDSYLSIFGAADAGMGATGTGVVNALPIEVGYDGSNVAGIDGCNTPDLSGCTAVDTAAAEAVETGLELGIELSDLGNPTGPIRVMLLQNNQGHDFLSNQTLGGLPAGTDNLGPGDMLDFGDFEGNQFFTVPEPATGLLLGLAACLLGMMRRRS